MGASYLDLRRSARSSSQRVVTVVGAVTPSERPRLFERIDLLPVALHVDHGPALRGRLVQGLVEPADRRLAVVGPLALGVRMVNEPHEAGAVAGGGPLEHLLIAVRVAEREDRAAADESLDADGLAGLVV